MRAAISATVQRIAWVLFEKPKRNRMQHLQTDCLKMYECPGL
jgi:hypothetical protein